MEQNAQLKIDNIFDGLVTGKLMVTDETSGKQFVALCSFTERQIAILKAGGLLNYTKEGGQ